MHNFRKILATCCLLIICLLSIKLECRPTRSTTKPIGWSDLFDLNNGANAQQRRAKRQDGSTTTCGYSSCPETDDTKINVHIIAHTHDDVGWLKTVDQYYYGTRKQDSPAGVEFILDSVIPQLAMDREKRFVYVEMSFFYKWWQEQGEQMRDLVRRLVDEGRLEFINGGWCMNDEATVNYHSTIEQMTIGLKFLNETFGHCARPKVGWQIDPFGHSNEQASLFAQFGFDGMFFTRIGYHDKIRRTDTKSLDLIWHGDRALSGQSGSIFTNIFRDGYDAPPGYCFDSLCHDDMIVDNKQSFEYNLEQRGQYMIQFMRRYASEKLTNQLLIPFGGDFQYSAAGQNFKSLDKLLRYVAENAPDLNVFYSTPSCYQFALHNELTQKADLKLPEKYDDFMPYDSESTVWWSGYFTSRPSVKLYEREVANLLQVSRQVSLESLLDHEAQQVQVQRQQQQLARVAERRAKQVVPKAKPWATKLDELLKHERNCLRPLWEILGDLQHHDAVTGTEKQHVTNDYIRRAFLASRNCAKFIGDHKRAKLGELVNKTDHIYEWLAASGNKLKLDPIFLEETNFCALNISQCEPLEVPIDACHHFNSNNLDDGAQQATLDHLKQQELCNKAPSMYRLASLRRNKSLPKELERKGVLLTAYNPLVSQAKNIDIRLPCIGRCDLEKVQIIHLATQEKLRPVRLSLPSGVDTLPFRNSFTKFEILFYANIPPLGSASFAISDSNEDDVVDDESDQTLESGSTRTRRDDSSGLRNSNNNQADCDHCELTDDQFVEIEMSGGLGEATKSGPRAARFKRDDVKSENDSGIGSDRVVVKFDIQTGMVVGLRRVSDGSFLNITQKFGTYSPSDVGRSPGAYIFRPNSLEPKLLEKPITFKMVKRNNGSLIEIHQKWADWIWQTIRVDGKKNYIEFDYVVGPVPIVADSGHEVVTRYITNMKNQGIFFTDSNGRQMLARTKLASTAPQQLGGSFFPVVSSMLIRSLKTDQQQQQQQNNGLNSSSSAEAVAILVDRPQAGTSLNEGNMEFLIHRRHTQDDNFGVSEALDEPGEDGRGLVTRGRHRLYIKFFASPIPVDQPEERQILDSSLYSSNNLAKALMIRLPPTPRANITYELLAAAGRANLTWNPKTSIRQSNADQDVYIVQDQLLNDLKQESIKYAFKPVLTFDRLRSSASQFVEMLDEKDRADVSLLNNSLPHNVHLLTLQTWNRKPNELLLRFENLDNPLTLTQFPSKAVYKKLINFYRTAANQLATATSRGASTPPTATATTITSNNNDYNSSNSSQQGNKNNKLQRSDLCQSLAKLETSKFDIEYLLKRIRIISLEEYNLGANVKLEEDHRLNWTQENSAACMESANDSDKPTTIKLSPRQIRTFLATYEFIA